MGQDMSLFERFLFEAPDDVPPDMAGGSGPPDIGDTGTADDGPPDLGDAGFDTGGEDGGPPDIADAGGDDSMGDFGGDDDFGDDGGDDGEQKPEDLGLDEKVSAIMNMNLYQRFLTLLNTIGSQLTMIKHNSDVLYTLSSDSLDIIANLKKLDENIRLYLKNTFVHENYSKNLLFFNKCLNLLKLLNDSFDGNVRKGIRAAR